VALNFMFCCMLLVGHFVLECESSGIGVLNLMYCFVLVVGHFVFECVSAGSGVLN